jgi:hypothetical protein
MRGKVHIWHMIGKVHCSATALPLQLLWTSLHGADCNGSTAGRPAAHFSWNYTKLLNSNPSWNCSYASALYPFTSYIGGSTFADVSNPSLYIVDNTNYVSGWANTALGYHPALCGNFYRAICEVGGANRHQHPMAGGCSETSISKHMHTEVPAPEPLTHICLCKRVLQQ